MNKRNSMKIPQNVFLLSASFELCRAAGKGGLELPSKYDWIVWRHHQSDLSRPCEQKFRTWLTVFQKTRTLLTTQDHRLLHANKQERYFSPPSLPGRAVTNRSLIFPFPGVSRYWGSTEASSTFVFPIRAINLASLVPIYQPSIMFNIEFASSTIPSTNLGQASGNLSKP